MEAYRDIQSVAERLRIFPILTNKLELVSDLQPLLDPGHIQNLSPIDTLFYLFARLSLATLLL